MNLLLWIIVAPLAIALLATAGAAIYFVVALCRLLDKEMDD